MNNIRNFAEGNTNYYLDSVNMTAQHIREQAIYRAYLCNDCLLLAKCKGCKCPTPALFYAPNKKDKYGKWSKMLSKEKWQEFKVYDQVWKEIDSMFKENNESIHADNVFDNIIRFTRNRRQR